MLGKRILAFVLCSNLFGVFAADQKGRESLPDGMSSAFPLTSLLMTYLYQLDELAKPYCQKHTDILSVWCSGCKRRRLSLGEFSGCLLFQAFKEIAQGKEAGKTKVAFENFSKLLTLPDTKESDMVDFVLQALKDIECPCPYCRKTSWEKVPENSISSLPIKNS